MGEDPPLAALLREVFGDRPWRYRRIAERDPSEREHLSGFDPAAAPRFTWPDRTPPPAPRSGPRWF